MKHLRKFNETVTQDMLKNTKVGKTCFRDTREKKSKYSSNEYRLSGYLYVYDFSDGGRTWAAVPKEFANAVTGTGVAGCICNLKDIEILERETPWSDERVEAEIQSQKRRAESEKGKYEMIKKIEDAYGTGLTEDEYQDIAMDLAINSAMKSFRN
jgi:hypothetical protein